MFLYQLRMLYYSSGAQKQSNNLFKEKCINSFGKLGCVVCLDVSQCCLASLHKMSTGEESKRAENSNEAHIWF